MRALVKLMIFGILVFWVGPSAWHRLSVANRVEIDGFVKNLQDEANQLIRSIEQASSGATSASTGAQPAQETLLMQPGLWSFNATETIGGRTMTVSGTQCVTPEKVAEMTTGNGLIFNPTGGNCQVQGGRQGRQVFANGQCVAGNMSMQMSVQMTFDTPQHVYGQMSAGGTRGNGFVVTVDGHRVGGC
jgi:hypothetical protein